ncbi:kinase-like domain-containing protein [Rhizophagus irregularis DAOM 181602=DAOM 197198]|nr:kinase-like domain-containing protein [Rhizophagus irregularis DAOM 181602=DAOM 197198]
MGGPIKHPKNVLRHKGIIKLADFGCSCLKESDNNTGAHGVTPYMDPRFYENQSRKTPFKYKTGDDCALRLRILSSLSEEPMPNTETRMLYSSNCIRNVGNRTR